MTRLIICSIVTSVIFLTSPSFAQEHYTIYLLGGQSNAAGKAPSSDLPVVLQSPQPDIQIFHGDNSGNGIWQDLKPGLSQEGSNFFGPEITFGRDLAEAEPDSNVRIIKYALGDTTLHRDWNPDTPGAQYTAFRSTVSNALANLTSSGDTYTIAGMIWMQGESDGWSRRSTLGQSQEYGNNLTGFISAIRTDLELPDLPFVIGKISNSDFWNQGEFVRNGQELVNQTVANTSIVDTDDLNLIEVNQLHYDAPGQQALGSRFASIFTVAPTLLGDANLDGVVNFFDIASFVAALSSSNFLDEADVNQDEVVNFLDISPFVGILSGS